MIHIREIDHLVLRVVDLKAMLRFYVEALGCPIERQQDAIGLVQLRAGNSLIDLVPIDGKNVSVQIGMNMAVVGSKDAEK